MVLNELLRYAVEKRASDIHLKVGTNPIFRINGNLNSFNNSAKLSSEEITGIASSLMNTGQKQRFEEKSDIDFSYGIPGVGRFRVNIFKQRGTIELVFRYVPNEILSFKELNLPPVIENMTSESRGLILVTGSTGSGKSTTLAAMLDHINRTRSEHIITIEDPIEFMHQDRKSIVSQREVGIDTNSFSLALRSVLREDPNVIMVGEMRDQETIAIALLAAEMGHLVLSTLHTLDAAETINRIITVFPPNQDHQIRLQIAAVLKGLISMRLVQRAEGRERVPAVEIMVSTPTIREAIITPDKTRLIPDLIAKGYSQYKMQTFDQSLYSLYQKKLITSEEALKWCTNPAEFILKLEGIQSMSEQMGELKTN